MQRIASFEKVSFNQFRDDWQNNHLNVDDIDTIYRNIVLPKRATAGSAGYDFFAPADFSLKPGASILIPSGIRARIADGYVLMIFPRSSLGFKYRLQLNNTVGIIDADYYGAANEGHIMFRLTNDSKEDRQLNMKAGQAVVQGIFLPFGITMDDCAQGIRTGGFGSTEK